MSISISEVQKLSPVEKLELYHILESDPDIAEQTVNENNDKVLFQEIDKRDKAYQQGKMQLTTIADLEQRLQTMQ